MTSTGSHNPAERHCLNCGTPLTGAFCPHCGQKDQDRRVRLRHLLPELLDDLLHYDHLVLRSLWLLVSRPGFLTQEFMAGRRVRHVSPFRLYVAISFVLFTAFSLVPTGNRHRAGNRPMPEIQVIETPPQVAVARKKPVPPWAQTIKTRAHNASQDPERFKHAFLTNLSRALFVLMPLLAGFLLLLHLRGRTFFMEHMVLSLHFHCFSFLVILALTGLALLPGDGWGDWPGILLFFTPPIYLAVALQRLYRRGWLRSAVKAALATGLYGLVVCFALLGLLYLSLPA